MYLDMQTQLSASQAISGNFGTAIPSTNTYDNGSATADLGTGEPVYAYVQCDTTVVGGSGGVKIDLIQSANANLSSPDILASITTAATPAAGTELMKLVVPPTTKRYIGFQYTPQTSNTTAGNFTAYLVKNTQNATY